MFASELTTMIEAGAGLILGTAAADGTPRGIRAWAAWVVDPDTQRLRVVMTGDDQPAVDNLEGRKVAVTAADIRTVRSVQLKGRVVSVGQLTPSDSEITERQTQAFFAAVHATDGNPMDLLRVMLPSSHVVIEMLVDEQYDQTPGPTAGTPMQTGRA